MIFAETPDLLAAKAISMTATCPNHPFDYLKMIMRPSSTAKDERSAAPVSLSPGV